MHYYLIQFCYALVCGDEKLIKNQYFKSKLFILIVIKYKKGRNIVKYDYWFVVHHIIITFHCCPSLQLCKIWWWWSPSSHHHNIFHVVHWYFCILQGMSFTMFKKSFLIKDILNHREDRSNVQCLACFSPAIVEPYLFKTAADSSVSTVASIWPFIQSTNNTSSWTSGKH